MSFSSAQLLSLCLLELCNIVQHFYLASHSSLKKLILNGIVSSQMFAEPYFYDIFHICSEIGHKIW